MNGTYVNGDRVDSMVVNRGDWISAGKTTFYVRVDGAYIDVDDKSTLLNIPLLQPHFQAEFGDRMLDGTFSSTKCSSGLTRYTSARTEVPVEQLALRLALEYRCIAIHDSHKTENHLPDHVESEFLMDWLNTETVESLSPRVAIMDSTEALASVIDANWGKNGLLLLFTLDEPGALVESLRRSAKNDDDVQNATMLWWPVILAPFLMHSDAAVVSESFGASQVTLMEEVGEPGNWQCFGPETISTQFKGWGMRDAEPGI